MTTPDEAERLLIHASARLHNLTDGPTHPGFFGLAEALRGIPPMPRHTDDGKNDDARNGPSVLPTEDEADRATQHIATLAKRIARDADTLADVLHDWRRLGLPRSHPARKPTKEERAVTSGQSIDDDTWCTSCLRIGHHSPRWNRMLVCQWCAGVLKDLQAIKPSIKAIPEDLLQLHADGIRVYPHHLEHAVSTRHAKTRRKKVRS